jgi:hypothetical protein
MVASVRIINQAYLENITELQFRSLFRTQEFHTNQFDGIN